MVARLHLVAAQKPFAGIAARDTPFAPRAADELHQRTELPVGELQRRVFGGASRRKDREQPPAPQPQREQVLLELVEPGHERRRDAGHGVEGDRRLGGGHAHRLRSAGETERMAAQTVVLGLESVDRDGHRVQSRPEQSVEPLRRERHAVGDHPPRVFAVVERTADPFQVGAHEHLAAREDDHHAVRIDAGRDLAVEHAEKILGRHVLAVGRGRAVRTAVAAPEVAAQRTLPEERAQFVPLHRLAVKPAVEFQPQPFTQRKMSSVHATPLRFSPRVRRRRPSARNARTSNFPRPGPSGRSPQRRPRPPSRRNRRRRPGRPYR